MEIRSYVPTTPDRGGPDVLPAANRDGNPGGSREQQPQQPPNATAGDAGDGTLNLQAGSQPLSLIVKITGDKIIAVFELPEPALMSLPAQETTAGNAAARLVGLLARALHAFTGRFADGDSDQAMDRFVLLAQQAIDEALTEARSILVRLHSDGDALDALLEDFAPRLRQGLEHVASRIIL